MSNANASNSGACLRGRLLDRGADMTERYRYETVFAVRSEKQRKLRNGQSFISRDLARAVTEATYAAKRIKQRMYVVVVRIPVSRC